MDRTRTFRTTVSLRPLSKKDEYRKRRQNYHKKLTEGSIHKRGSTVGRLSQFNHRGAEAYLRTKFRAAIAIGTERNFRDYRINSLKLKGEMKVIVYSNGCSTETNIIVVGGCRPSMIGRDLMPQLEMQLVQATAGGAMNVQGPSEN